METRVGDIRKNTRMRSESMSPDHMNVEEELWALIWELAKLEFETRFEGLGMGMDIKRFPADSCPCCTPLIPLYLAGIWSLSPHQMENTLRLVRKSLANKKKSPVHRDPGLFAWTMNIHFTSSQVPRAWSRTYHYPCRAGGESRSYCIYGVKKTFVLINEVFLFILQRKNVLYIWLLLIYINKGLR